MMISCEALTQQEEDTLDNIRLAQKISMSEVTVNSGINVPWFLKQVKEDTTFYKAFRSLHMVGFTSWNDVRIKDKIGRIKTPLQSKTRR
ncbi:MAG: hypothetical protein IPH18_08600 [Chitinophagaceae bacterium]|nr:hypothetical protein [Chitinophagaceae bacterium]MBK8951642.1 hypothetical protein [Chitinophagaceae bacterium]